MEEQTIENFFGVYLLYCQNPKYLGRTYIGFTVDPNRRIKQHNKGKKYGGAWKTSNRGPWTMVMIIHGFPNDISALRFEWAWQHPQVSRRLNHVPKKNSREKLFNYNLRVLSVMLQTGPWNRLPLTVRWLAPEFAQDFPINATPPMHMPICFGGVKSKKVSSSQESNNKNALTHEKICSLCNEIITNRVLTCLNQNCYLIAHPICLSKHFLKFGEYVPIEGKCPSCFNTFLWGDLIRKANGCYGNLEINITPDVGDQFYESE